MADEYGLVNLLVSAYKDAVEEKELEKIKEEYQQLQKTEADARRSKAEAKIRQMAALKTELTHFEHTYQLLVKKTGKSVPAIEDYIKKIEMQIKRISCEKNHRST